jgi:hypothetical protein
MKSACCTVLLVAGLVLTGCGKDENSSGPSTTVAPVNNTPPPAQAGNGYVGALVKAQQLAVKTVDLTSLNQAIQLFNEQEGHLPADLNELAAKHYVGQLPAAPAGMKLVYDAAQGKVTVAPQ